MAINARSINAQAGGAVTLVALTRVMGGRSIFLPDIGQFLQFVCSIRLTPNINRLPRDSVDPQSFRSLHVPVAHQDLHAVLTYEGQLVLAHALDSELLGPFVPV